MMKPWVVVILLWFILYLGKEIGVKAEDHEYVFGVFYNKGDLMRDTITVGQQFLNENLDTRAGSSKVTLVPQEIESNDLVAITQQMVNTYGDKMMGVIGPTRTDQAMEIKNKFPKLIMFTSATGSNITMIPPEYEKKRQQSTIKPEMYAFQMGVNDYDVASTMVDAFFSLGLKKVVLVYKSSSEFSTSIMEDCQIRINQLQEMSVHTKIAYSNDVFEPVYEKLQELKETDTNGRLGVILLNSQKFDDFFTELEKRDLINSNKFTYIVNTELMVENENPTTKSLLYLEPLESPFYQINYLLVNLVNMTGKPIQDVNHDLVVNNEATFVYDSILSVQKVVYYQHHVIELDNTMKPKEFQDILRSSFRVVDFVGSTGRVTYIDNGNRFGISLRLFNIDENGKSERVADWSMDKHLTWRSSVKSNKIPIYLGGNEQQKFDSFFSATSTAIGNQWYVSPLYGVIPTVVSNFVLSLEAEENFVVLYGGRQGQNLHDDLYGFDLKLKRWFYLPAVSAEYPPAVELGMGTIVKDSFYLVGGRSEDLNIMDQMWEYSFSTYHWEDISQIVKKPDSPGPRIRGDVSTLENGKGFAFFGGENPNSLKKDVWIFHVKDAKWQKFKRVSPAKIQIRCNMVMEYHNEIFFIFGGRTSRIDEPGVNPQVNDFWLFRQSDLYWIELDNNKIGGSAVPKAREGHRSVRYAGYLYMGFGYTSIANEDAPNHYYDDLWRIEMDDAKLISGQAKWEKKQSFKSMGVQSRAFLGMIEWDSKLIWFGGDRENVDFYKDFSTDMWMYNVISDRMNQIHKPFDSPALVTCTTLMNFGSKVIVYGGRYSTGAASELAFEFDLENNSWKLVTTVNSYGAFEGISSSFFSSTNYLHGGSNQNSFTAKTMNADYSNDVLTFHDIEYDTKYSIARSHHSSVTIDKFMYIIGGQSSNGPIYDIQRYDIFARKWEQTFSGNSKNLNEAPTSLMHCASISQGDYIYVASCGRVFQLDPSRVSVWRFDTLKAKTDQQWKEYSNYIDEIYQGQSFLATGIDEFFTFGGELGEKTSRNTFHIKQGKMQVTHAQITSPEKPTARFDHRTIYYKNNVFVVSGTGGIIFKENPNFSKASETIITADSWVFHFGTPCNPTGHNNDPNCTSCAPGSFYHRDSCYPCKPGEYSDGFNTVACSKCPMGTYAGEKGSFDSSFCLPCPSGTQNNGTGKGECTTCSDPDLCPIGSTKELVKPWNISTNIVKHIPPVFKSNPVIDKISLGIRISFIVVGVIIPIIMYFFWRSCPCIKTSHIQNLDFLFTNNHGAEILRSEEPASSSEEDEEIPEKKKSGVLNNLLKRKKKKKAINVRKVKVIKKTVIGGLFTILAGCIYLQFIITDLVSYFSSNSDVETIGLVPLVRFSDSSTKTSQLSESTLFYAYIESTITVHGYHADGNCSTVNGKTQDIFVDQYNFVSVNESRSSVHCLQKEDEYGQLSCECKYRCYECALTSTTGRLSWKFYQTGSFGQWIEYSIATTTGYDLDRASKSDPFSYPELTMSSISGKLRPQPGYLYRGTTPPIYVDLAAVNTLYRRVDSRVLTNINPSTIKNPGSLLTKTTSRTGMHLDWKGHTVGQEVNEKNFHTENGIRVDLRFTLSTDGLLITRASKMALGEYLASLLAQITGIVALVAIIMGVMEMLYIKLGFVNEEGQGTTTFKLLLSTIFNRLSSFINSPRSDLKHEGSLEEHLYSHDDNYDPIDDDFPIPSQMRSRMIDNFDTP